MEQPGLILVDHTASLVRRLGSAVGMGRMKLLLFYGVKWVRVAPSSLKLHSPFGEGQLRIETHSPLFPMELNGPGNNFRETILVCKHFYNKVP